MLSQFFQDQLDNFHFCSNIFFLLLSAEDVGRFALQGKLTELVFLKDAATSLSLAWKNITVVINKILYDTK